MKVILNGYFTEHPLTGSGQYLQHLQSALTALSPDDEFQIAPWTSGYSRLGRRLGKLLWEQIGFPAAVRDADLSHVPYMGSPLRGRNDLVTVHDLIGFVLPEYAASPWMRAYNRMAAASVRRARLILADSTATARDLRRILGIPESRIRTVLLGVDENMRPSSKQTMDAVRDHYELPSRFVLYLGSGDTRKNLDVLLHAWFLTPAARRVPLVLAGRIPCTGTEFFPDYQRLARELGVEDSVIWLGPVTEEEKAPLLSAAAVFAFPSLYEGFGLEPLEAMACGTPVVCSDATSLPEVVGDAALLVNPRDPGAWSTAIGEVLDDPATAARLSDAGRERASRLTWRATAAATLAAYGELL